VEKRHSRRYVIDFAPPSFNKTNNKKNKKKQIFAFGFFFQIKKKQKNKSQKKQQKRIRKSGEGYNKSSNGPKCPIPTIVL
jgi:hypothetical protein